MNGRFHLTPHEVIDTWTGESHGGRAEKPPLVIDRRHLSAISNEEARILADLFHATVIYKEKSQ